VRRFAVIIALLCGTACPPRLESPQADSKAQPVAAAAPAVKAAAGVDRYAGIERAKLPKLERHEFNRLAALESVQLYWRAGPLEPGAFVMRTEIGRAGDNPYLRAGAFTPAFDALYVRLVDLRRREAVTRELNSGWPIAVVTDLRTSPEPDRQLVRHVMRAAKLIEELYAIQLGTAAVGEPPADPPSRELLRRTHSYKCEGPETREDPFCHGLLSFAAQRSDAYPQDVEQDAAFCEQLRQAPNAKALMDPFSVVRRQGEGWTAVPYLDIYGDRMRRVALELRTAAAALGGNEEALKKYLLAAAQGFETNSWDAADEAWVAMNSSNSKWYLRIAPDEVYFDPCNSKAGFHVSFARINPALLEWQRKLTPLREQMEAALAAKVGAPYAAREVSFALPDFIDIVINAGDSRNPFGATVGQALPNWGPVAERGDGRTVVMTNLYSTPDSRAVALEKAALLLHPDSLPHLRDQGISEYLEILLHEATHNFGPHSDYKIGGKPPREIFGGLTASILEELKAQTGALWFTGWLQQKGLLDKQTTTSAYTGSIMWCFSQISRGLYRAEGKRSVYPTIAAIHIGYFLDEGALSFDPLLEPGQDGDAGRFVIHYDKLPAAIDKLMQRVGQIKAKGDKASAEQLIARYSDAAGQAKIQYRAVQERVLRFSKESFGYSVLF